MNGLPSIRKEFGMKFGRIILFCMVLCAKNIPLFAQENLIPRVSMGKTEQFKIDGVIAPEEIRLAAGMYGFNSRNTSGETELFPPEAKFYIGTNGKDLYIASECEISPSGILQRANKDGNPRQVLRDDHYDLTIVPIPGEKKSPWYRLAVNQKGAVFASARKNGTTFEWKAQMTSSGSVKNNRWTMEMLIPLAQFGIMELKDAQSIGVGINRTWYGLNPVNAGARHIKSSWSQCHAEPEETEMLPIVTYYQDMPIVHFEELRNGTVPAPAAAIFNPTAQPVKVQTSYQFKPSESQSIDDTGTETIMANTEKKVTMRVPQFVSGERANTSFKVTSSDGRVLYFRNFTWRADKQEMFQQSSLLKDSVAFHFAFYPSSNRLFLKLDLSALNPADCAIPARAAVYTGETKRKLAECVLPAPNREKQVETVMVLPDLKRITQKENKSGEYELELSFGKNKLRRTFYRESFAWEENRFGKSDTPVPPFTPVEVQDHCVSVILGKHTFNKGGLWAQVDSEGVELLSGSGMTLSAVIDGKKYSVSGQGVHFTERGKTFAKGYADWTLGPVRGKTRFHFDMDGMMMCYLDFPASGNRVDSLVLTVSMPEHETPLFHCCSDSLRNNYAGKTPEKWESRQAHKTEMQTSHCMYIWTGNETRGFSVSGDNDKGWSAADGVSSQTIHHENGQTILTLNLFAAPLRLDKARSIELAFQATPVKPMPEEWRLMQADWGLPHDLRKYLKYWMIFYGSNSCQGGVENSLLPRDGANDLTFWHKLAEVRQTKKIPTDFIEKYMTGYPVKDQRKLNTFRAEINYGFRQAMDSFPGTVTFYTNLRGQRLDIPESRTFLDDWFREEFQPSRDRVPGWAACRSYSIDPVESYRDYAIDCHKKLFDTGACDNIYWDDVYPSASYDRSGLTRAYTLPDGKLQPQTGYFDMREMIRRTAVLQSEMKRIPNNMVHMTNVGAAPLLAFAQQDLDWEDQLGTNAFQERYTREYIRAISIGRQFGNLPVALGLVPRDAEKTAKEKCLRSGCGVVLTHEIQWVMGSVLSATYKKILKEFYEFGYGQKGVRVWNYWEKNYPLHIKGGETSSILLQKDKEALIVVCNYSGNTSFTLSLDTLKKFTAVDAESGRPLPVKNGELIFNMSHNDFIYLKLKEK